MKAIKSILLFSMLAAVPAFGDVEALYWQIDTLRNAGGVTFDYAVLVGVDGTESAGHHYMQDDAGGTFQASRSDDHTTTEVIASVLDSSVDYTGWKFYVELWNYSDGKWVQAGTAGEPGSTYTQLKTDNAIRSSMSLAQPLPFTPTVVIPEPTSGLLVLVGGALLALRRRRRA